MVSTTCKARVFYVSAAKIGEFSSLLVNLTNHFWKNEFTPAKCEEVVKEGGQCQWPQWHNGVASLYATDLAANHLLGNQQFQSSQVTTKLDHGSTNGLKDTMSMDEVAQIHLLGVKHEIGVDSSMVAFCDQAKKVWPGEWYDPQQQSHGAKSVPEYVLGVLTKSIEEQCKVDMVSWSSPQAALLQLSVERPMMTIAGTANKLLAALSS